jgi:deazaflavin-dependent oxidoreductase (nitroreductase family)
MALSVTPTINNSTDSTLRAFPARDTMLFELINNPEFKKNFHTKLQTGNRFMAFFYKTRLLPLFGMGQQIMLLTTKGRSSQKWRDFPIGYYRIDGTVYVFSGWGKAANWYKNIIANPKEVFLQVGFHHFHAIPEVVEGAEELRKTFERFVSRCPKGAQQLIGWDPQRDSLETADFSMMMEKVLVVRFHVG